MVVTICKPNLSSLFAETEPERCDQCSGTWAVLPSSLLGYWVSHWAKMACMSRGLVVTQKVPPPSLCVSSFFERRLLPTPSR